MLDVRTVLPSTVSGLSLAVCIYFCHWIWKGCDARVALEIKNNSTLLYCKQNPSHCFMNVVMLPCSSSDLVMDEHYTSCMCCNKLYRLRINIVLFKKKKKVLQSCNCQCRWSVCCVIINIVASKKIYFSVGQWILLYCSRILLKTCLI